jgi:GntR family transcriptional regulator
MVEIRKRPGVQAHLPDLPGEIQMADPMWRQIAEDLRLKIVSGELGADGAPLPSELELAEAYAASRNTVRNAVKWLVNRGLLVPRPGQGTFVAQEIEPFVTVIGSVAGEAEANLYEVSAYSTRPSLSPLRVEIHRADGVVASELRLDTDPTVISRYQERVLDSRPCSLQTTFYPMRLVNHGATRLIQADQLSPGEASYLEEVLGIRQSRSLDRLAVRVPDVAEAYFFALPGDGRISVIDIIQTGFDEANQPFRMRVTTYAADRNVFQMTAGKVPFDVQSTPGALPMSQYERFTRA